MIKSLLWWVGIGGALMVGAPALSGGALAQQFPQQPQQPQGVALPMQAGQVDPTRPVPALQVPPQRVRVIVRPRSPFGF